MLKVAILHHIFAHRGRHDHGSACAQKGIPDDPYAPWRVVSSRMACAPSCRLPHPHLHHGWRQRGSVRPYIRLWGLFVVCPCGTRCTHADLPTLGRRLPLDGGRILAQLTEIARERRRRCGLARLVTTDGLRKDPDRPPGPPLWYITPPHSAYHRGPRRGPPRCWPSRSSCGRASLTVKGQQIGRAHV